MTPLDPKGISIISRDGWVHSAVEPVDKDNSWIQYFSVYFKFGFFSCCCPYYFKYDRAYKTYKPASFILQKVVCAFVQVMSLFVLVTRFREIRGQDLKKNPMLYIELASVGLNSCYMLGVIYTFWFKMHLFTILLNQLRTTLMAPYARGDLHKMKLLILLICGVAFVQAVISFLYDVEQNEWVLDKFLDVMLRKGKYMFFMREDAELEAGQADTIILLYFISSFYYLLMKNMADIVGTISVLIFRQILQDWLFAMKDKDYSAIMQAYDAFNVVLTKLNTAVGLFIFFFFLGPIPYYSINIITMLDAADGLLLLCNLIYLVNYFATIILSARVNNMAQELKDWLTTSEKFREILPMKLDLILHDISEYEIALSGLGYFYASSGLVGTIVSLILTYAILVVQFKSEIKPEIGGMGNDTVGALVAEGAAMLMNGTLFNM